MPDAPTPSEGLVPTHTTAASSSVAQWVNEHYGLRLAQCHLIRRGLNDNYALRSNDGVRHVARLYSIRPRGGLNIDFETALLAHLAARGAGVAAAVETSGGASWVSLHFPEGARALALFEHADGTTPETLEDFELTGAELGRIHRAARDYAGPPSRYELDGDHLAGRTLAYLRAYPEMDAELLASYELLVGGLLEELAAAEEGLTRVVCHGDTHGYNNHVRVGPDGKRSTVFFDFDDAGPGFLSYDLSVMPWSYLLRKGLKEPDDALRERWARYLGGLRAEDAGPSTRDLAALPLFIQLRHLWNIGEAAGRLHHWGTNNVSIDWLRKQLEMFEAWKKLTLAA
ncbi:Ser/Thr protein kinase RdoA involved in Cpx stress response, MazF antagonist [Burkholderiales bacterium 8X]|nr:Ser/Thr protein kinase RdoA involved in Cpx stress response, MazF antagonist [Burkholderiales bacterium 8X]